MINYRPEIFNGFETVNEKPSIGAAVAAAWGLHFGYNTVNTIVLGSILDISHPTPNDEFSVSEYNSALEVFRKSTNLTENKLRSFDVTINKILADHGINDDNRHHALLDAVDEYSETGVVHPNGNITIADRIKFKTLGTSAENYVRDLIWN